MSSRSPRPATCRWRKCGQSEADLEGPRRNLNDRLAHFRAFHTVWLVLADNTDDSYGVLGEVRAEAWLTYLSIDWRSAGIDPAVYWRDLCELRLWDPYAIDHGNTATWFEPVR